MAALDDISLNVFSDDEKSGKAFIAARMWIWLHDHQNDDFQFKVWVLTRSFKYKDLTPIFEILLGPDPIHWEE